MNTDEARTRLLEREQQLLNRLSKIAADLGSPKPQDSEERAIAVENDEVLEQLDQTERDELASIRAALARIESGTYATCSSCGDDIPGGRLEVLPFTTLCVGCAS